MTIYSRDLTNAILSNIANNKGEDMYRSVDDAVYTYLNTLIGKNIDFVFRDEDELSKIINKKEYFKMVRGFGYPITLKENFNTEG